MRNPLHRPGRIAAMVLLALATASCSDYDNVSVHGSVGMYYGTGYYDPWYYGPGYYRPPVIVTPPPPARPPSRPPARPPAQRPTPLPARPAPRPMPRGR